MKITNPTKEKIEVQIKGVKYSIEPESSIDNIDEEVARFWQEGIHKFLILRKDKLEDTKIDTEVIAVPEPKIGEVVVEETMKEVTMPEVETEVVIEEEKEVIETPKLKDKKGK